MRLGLGTVQFGADYGISNTLGKPSEEEVRGILDVASNAGIRCLDTASLYGSSEEVLGNCLAGGGSFDIVTKTPAFKSATIGSGESAALEETFRRSLKRLKRDSVYGLLLHHADDLAAPGGFGLLEKMRDLKEQGLVRKIGISAYRKDQIDLAMESGLIDLVQVPFSLLDQRLLEAGVLRKLKRSGVEIHVRSVFLQGLLLMEPSSAPRWFDSVRNHLQDIHAQTLRAGLSMLQAALGFALSIEEIDRVLVGVATQKELNEIIEAVRLCIGRERDLERIATHSAWSDEKILNPALWEKYA